MILALLACGPSDPVPADPTDAPAPTGETGGSTPVAESGGHTGRAPTGDTGGAGHSAGEPVCVPTLWATVQPASARVLQLSAGDWRELVPAGDLDGDGDAELLATDAGTWLVPEPEAGDLGPAALTLLDAAASKPRSLGDADRDGDPDLLLWNNARHPTAPGALVVWDGDGAGGLQAGHTYPWPAEFLYYEHVGGDGALAVGANAVDRDAPNEVWWVDPITAEPSLPRAARLTVELLDHGSYGWAPGLPGDVTGDGLDDLVALDAGNLLVFDGIRRGRVVEADADVDLVGGGGSLAPVGDLDGDGVADLVVQPAPRYVGDQAYLVPGGALSRTGVLASVATTRWWSGDRLDYVASVARVDDIDLDGRDDVAVIVDQDGPEASVAFVSAALPGQVDLSARSFGGIRFAALPESGYALESIAAADVDGDCVRELAVAGSDGAWLFSPVP